MGEVSHTVCAVDIDAAGSTFQQALALAQSRRAHLVLVCAVRPEEPFKRRAADRCACLLKLQRDADAAGVEVDVRVQVGEVSEIVLRHAGNLDPDLIVIGVDHGRSDGQKWGAVATKHMRSTDGSLRRRTHNPVQASILLTTGSGAVSANRREHRCHDIITGADF